ncbi:MAG: TetR/AcrR family transcriptional regulator [Bacteroidota bacterium]
MKPFFVNLEINPKLFIKDPQQTKLGRRIIEKSVLLIDEIGLEQFTFKKLARTIPSSEASIYRYFENKHHLFVYLLNWYWEWMIVRIEFNTMNINDAYQKLKVALNIIVDTANRNTAIEFVNEDVLHRIVVREGAKAYHHKLVDEENSDGFFLAYKRLCCKIADILEEINPQFPYPKALASTLVETANNNLYFARHLPRLTDLEGKSSDEDLNQQVKDMLAFFSFGLVNQKRQEEKPSEGSVPAKDQLNSQNF